MMIGSKPSDRPFLDHDIIVDRCWRIHVVIGNAHPPGEVLAYVKYVPTRRPSIWGGRLVNYERVLKRYSASNMRSSSSKHSTLTYDPVLGAPAPRVPLSEIREWLLPEVRLREIIARPSDPVELDVVSVVDALASAGLRPSSLGVTGSVLAGIHNVRYSDINMVVYGCKDALEAVEAIPGSLPEAGKDVLLKRVLGKARMLGLPPEVIRKVYPAFECRAVGGRPVGFTFVNPIGERYGRYCLKPLAVCEALIEVEGGSCSTLYYPSIADVTRVLEVRGPEQARQLVKSYGLRWVMSFEGLFRGVLFEGGRLLVRGVLEMRVPEERLVLLVGGFEEPGFVIKA